MNTTVIFHNADFDGIFCREIARKFLPNATLIGWNFGDALIPMPEGKVYILDLSPDCLEPDWQTTEGAHRRIIWIDHHKTSIDKWLSEIEGYRIDGVAACRLAWHWFICQPAWTKPETLASKKDFVERRVLEPLSVRLAGEYDVWDKRDPAAETFQYGLRCQDDCLDWELLIGSENSSYLQAVLMDGKIAQRYAQKMDADLVKYKSYRLQWEGLNFLVLNTGRFNSLTFAALDKPETGHDALMGYMFNGKVWTVSLYHAAHRTDIDLSEIAKKYGGGWHRGACGFTLKTLPQCFQ